MATYERFEDLPVWKAAIELAERYMFLQKDNRSKGNIA